MTSDLDVWKAARLLVKQHGNDAALVHAQRAEELLAQQDVEGQLVWKRILAAVNELQRTSPSANERLREFDFVKQCMLANVGVVGASIVILGAAFAALGSKDADLYQPMFAQVAMYMSGVVVACTGVAILLQILRSMDRYFSNSRVKAVLWIASVVLVLLPLYIGSYAAGVVTVAAVEGPKKVVLPESYRRAGWPARFLHWISPISASGARPT